MLTAAGVEVSAAHEGLGPEVVARTSGEEDGALVADFLAAQPEVNWVQPRTRVELKNLYAGRLIQAGDFAPNSPGDAIAAPIYERGLKGSGEVVGFIDDGLDYDHCFFANAAGRAPSDGSSSGPPDTANRKVLAFRYNAQYGSAEGNTQHGTHTAGTAVGLPLPSSGGEDVQQHGGVASEAKLTFISIKNKTDPNRLLTLYWDRAFALHYADGARVHSNSWGCAPATDNPSECNVYDQDALVSDMYMWNYTDALLVFAAGNDGSANVAAGKAGTVSSPATSKNGLSVGATMTSPGGWAANAATVATDYGCSSFPDWCSKEKMSRSPELYSQENVAGFSSGGPAWDGRVKPDLVAPGFFVVSAKSDNNPSSFNCGLRSEAGTSMSAPVVAGAAALVRQYFREGWWPSGTKRVEDGIEAPQSSLIKAVLINGARATNATTVADFHRIATISPSNPAVPIGPPKMAVPNAYQGFGRARLDTVLQFSDSPFQLTFCDGFAPNPGAAPVAITVSFGTAASLSVPFRATLAWTDYPATPAAAIALVNNLDLTLVRESRIVYPNGANGTDNTNNVEHIELPKGTAASPVTLRVSSRTLPQGPQPYSLVITGSWASITGCTRTLSVPFSALPRGPLTVAVPSPLPSADSGLVVMALLTLQLDFSLWPARVEQFRRAVAQQIRVAHVRVVVERATAGSTRVLFYISNAEYPSERRAADALQDLAALNTAINLGPGLVATALSFTTQQPTVLPETYTSAASSPATPTPLPGAAGLSETTIVIIAATVAGTVVIVSAGLIIWMAVRWSHHAIRRAVAPSPTILTVAPAASGPGPSSAALGGGGAAGTAPADGGRPAVRAIGPLTSGELEAKVTKGGPVAAKAAGEEGLGTEEAEEGGSVLVEKLEPIEASSSSRSSRKRPSSDREELPAREPHARPRPPLDPHYDGRPHGERHGSLESVDGTADTAAGRLGAAPAPIPAPRRGSGASAGDDGGGASGVTGHQPGARGARRGGGRVPLPVSGSSGGLSAAEDGDVLGGEEEPPPARGAAVSVLPPASRRGSGASADGDGGGVSGVTGHQPGARGAGRGGGRVPLPVSGSGGLSAAEDGDVLGGQQPPAARGAAIGAGAVGGGGERGTLHRSSSLQRVSAAVQRRPEALPRILTLHREEEALSALENVLDSFNTARTGPELPPESPVAPPHALSTSRTTLELTDRHMEDGSGGSTNAW